MHPLQCGEAVFLTPIKIVKNDIVTRFPKMGHVFLLFDTLND